MRSFYCVYAPSAEFTLLSPELTPFAQKGLMAHMTFEEIVGTKMKEAADVLRTQGVDAMLEKIKEDYIRGKTDRDLRAQEVLEEGADLRARIEVLEEEARVSEAEHAAAVLQFSADIVEARINAREQENQRFKALLEAYGAPNTDPHQAKPEGNYAVIKVLSSSTSIRGKRLRTALVLDDDSLLP